MQPSFVSMQTLLCYMYPLSTRELFNSDWRSKSKNNIPDRTLVVDFRVVGRFLSRRFHPKSRRLFPFYFSNITLRTNLLTFRVTGTVFKIASEMRRLPAYFDNPEIYAKSKMNIFCLAITSYYILLFLLTIDIVSCNPRDFYRSVLTQFTSYTTCI